VVSLHWQKVLILCLSLAVLTLTSTWAQDSNKGKPVPVPLAPGVNKGNVDNIEGAKYFSFWAGPGPVKINMAFKDMGVFGNPLRQVMHFNIYTADGTLLTPYTVD
jgi:hypothetical protein